MKLCKDCEKKYFFWPKCEKCFKESEKHKNYINKEKIIIWLNKQISTCLCDELKEAGKLTAYYKVIEFIKNGEFDKEE